MRFARPVGVEHGHFQQLVNKVGTAVLTLNEPFSMARKQRGHTSPRLVSERCARLLPSCFHHPIRERIRDYAIPSLKFTPTDSHEEPYFLFLTMANADLAPFPNTNSQLNLRACQREVYLHLHGRRSLGNVRR